MQPDWGILALALGTTWTLEITPCIILRKETFFVCALRALLLPFPGLKKELGNRRRRQWWTNPPLSSHFLVVHSSVPFPIQGLGRKMGVLAIKPLPEATVSASRMDLWTTFFSSWTNKARFQLLAEKPNEALFRGLVTAAGQGG